jgi:hypothetical protein
MFMMTPGVCYPPSHTRRLEKQSAQGRRRRTSTKIAMCPSNLSHRTRSATIRRQSATRASRSVLKLDVI